MAIFSLIFSGNNNQNTLDQQFAFFSLPFQVYSYNEDEIV